MAVLELLGGGVANLAHVDVEEEGLAGEWMIGVDDDDVLAQLDDAHRQRLSFVVLADERVADGELGVGGKAVRGTPNTPSGLGRP